MGIYGDYRPSSDGWDDGFSAMVDSGDDASAYVTTFRETAPPDDVVWDEYEDWSDYREPDPDSEAALEWAVSDGEHRKWVVLDEWVATWMALSPDLRDRFMARRELDRLTCHPRWVVLAAVHREQKLAGALAFADAVRRRVGYDLDDPLGLYTR